MLSDDRRTGAVNALSRKDRVAWVEALFADLRVVAARSFPPDVRVEIGGGELAQAAANNSTVVRHKLENMLQIASDHLPALVAGVPLVRGGAAGAGAARCARRS